MRKFLIAALACFALAAFSTGGASAAPNPHAPGQPSVECNEDGLGPGPAGFATGGFANAERHYAGGEDSHSSDNPKAVAQYDVACYQLTNNH